MTPRTASTYGVVIPCKNEAADIADCVAALAAQTPAPQRIILMDNGSTDGSQALAAPYAEVVDAAAIRGIGALRNAGAARLDAVDVIAFVDADCVVTPGWARGMLDAISGGLDAAGERCLAPETDPWVARRWAVLEDTHGGTLLWTQDLAVRSEAFAAVGGFDERLATREDSDLSQRLIDAGYRVGRAPAMVAIHRGFAPTLRAFARRERWHTSTRGWFASMGPKSQLLVLGAASWAVVGVGTAVAGVATRRMAPVGWWAALTAAALPPLGVVGGRSLRHAPVDGALLAWWALVRATRLSPAELRDLRELRELRGAR
ncbi:MAG: glycosyltransferase [Austwickia sp.]|jgi:GT2 family glycosyltransferase|nr:MAG: glycosyltransferase [Austwickia sp.]